MNALPQTYLVTYILNDDSERRVRRVRVSISEGYSTVESIPRILAVKHYSTNNDEAVAKINVMHTLLEEN
jgi:hypothetical protein